MATFEIAYAITRKIEGGWHGGTGINANDRGGETFKGIARKFWGTWKGWAMVDALKSKPGFPKTAESDPVLSQLVKEFFKLNFWNPLKLDQVSSQEIANELFDTAVNSGTKAAAEFLQKGLNYLNRGQASWKNIDVDGKVGPATLLVLAKLNQEDTRALFNLLNIIQGRLFLNIMDKDESQEINIRGWLKRIEIKRE